MLLFPNYCLLLKIAFCFSSAQIIVLQRVHAIITADIHVCAMCSIKANSHIQ